MAEPFTWEMIPKSQDDNSLITDAIDEAIADHNNDVDAHLEDGQALKSHRASEVIDHIAESVVNDKLQRAARAYVAIVGSGAAEDYDTVQAAIAYAVGVGGGTILILPGEYYLDGAVSFPLSVNIEAIDPETVTIHGSYTSTDYLKIVDDATSGQVQQTIRNIKFVNDGGGIFHSTSSDLTYLATQIFENCSFDGGGQYLFASNLDIICRDSVFYISNTAAVSTDRMIKLYDSRVLRYGSATTCYFVDLTGSSSFDRGILLENSTLDCTGATTSQYIFDSSDGVAYFSNSRIVGWASDVAVLFLLQCFNTYISLKSNHSLTLQSDGTEGVVMGCTFIPAGSGTIICNEAALGFVGNMILGGYGDFDSSIRVYAAIDVSSYEILPNATTACAMATALVKQLTPNSTRTLSAGAVRAGERRTLIILTSGTTSYTLTFGSGFKSTGTLATGVTSARRFIINFISDGTSLIEMSRTTAIA